MLNKYPLWKYLMIAVIVVMAALYALPNLYGEDPAIQVSSSSRGAKVDETTLAKVVDALQRANVPTKAARFEEERLLIRFADTEEQLKAVDRIKEALGTGYVVALNLAPSTPNWLRSLDAAPMYLGLDLRGGVHFLMEVDMAAAVRQSEENYVTEVRSLLRKARVRYLTVTRGTGGVRVKFANDETRDLARQLLGKEFPALQLRDSEDGDSRYLLVTLSDTEQEAIRDFALQQNIITLRNRVNELGVAEPVIQQQGLNRIVVQLPGVQDTARAKEILGATATLEYRLVDTEHDIEAALAGRVPVNSKLYTQRDGRPILLRKQIIVTGDQIIDAASTIDENGAPAVTVRLDGKGGRRMSQVTSENIGKPMAVVFIENRTETRFVDSQPVRTTKRIEEVINVATIRDHFRPPASTAARRLATSLCCCAPARWPRRSRLSKSVLSVRAWARTTSSRASTPCCSVSRWCWSSWRSTTGFSAWWPTSRWP